MGADRRGDAETRENCVAELLGRFAPMPGFSLPERGVNDLLRDVREPGIEIVGEVASAADFLGGLSVLLYPLQRGSGMKVKVSKRLPPAYRW